MKEDKESIYTYDPSLAKSYNSTSSMATSKHKTVSITSGSDQRNNETNIDDILEDNALNSAFRDLSTRSSIFRTRLIEEFALLENLSLTGGNVAPPQLNTRDVRDPIALKRILLESPYQLIKFQVFKRAQKDGRVEIDRRLTRIKNKKSVPIGAWAAWVVDSNTFQNLMLVFIVLNAISVGIVSELSDTQEQYIVLFQVLNMFDTLSLMIFILEIILRWTDSFKNYWNDYWNIFDFFVTVSTAIPDLLQMFGALKTSGSFGTIIRQLRTFRILRALKIAVRFTSLRIIVGTIIEVMQSMVLIMALVLMCLFIFGVIGVYTFDALTSAPSSQGLVYGLTFANLGSSIEVLFQLITLDNWNDVVSDMLTVVDPVVTYVYVIVWICIGSFIIKNIFIGVMVSNFNRISKVLREKYQERVKQKKLDRMRRRLKKELDLAKTNIHSSRQNLADSSNQPISSAINMNKGKTQFEVPNTVESKKALTRSVQQLINEANGNSKDWAHTMEQTLSALGSIKSDEQTLWPRDTLFKYLQLMESMQENMREYQELQLLANTVLLELHNV